MDPQLLKSKIEAVKQIPTLPGVLSKMTAMIHDPETSTEQLGGVISRDQVLAAKVLKLINSSFYGFPGRISSVSHALVLLGFNVIKGMVVSASVFDMMNRAVVGLWEHSLGCATLSGIIARKLGEKESEEVFVAGLLHDIGKVMIKVSLPDDYDRIQRMSAVQEIVVREAEQEIVGVDHARIAQWVAAQWHLPEAIAEPMVYHHEPLGAGAYARRTAMVHLADVLIQAVGFGSGGNVSVPPLDEDACSLLNADEGFMEAVLLELEENLDSLSAFSLEA